ncbi:MAG: hypothetical protein ACYDBV_15475 [Nitrospiria bacterium]
MKIISFLGVFLSSVLIFSSLAQAAEGPYLSIDVGEYGRRIEETNVNGANSIKFYGTTDSTRVLTKFGFDLNFIDLYFILGGSTLTIQDFDGYHGNMGLAYGGGFKILMFQSPTRERFSLFLNPEVLKYTTNDTIQIFSQSQGLITENHEISLTEYEVKAGGSARYDMIEPYGGVRYSWVSGQETGGPQFGTADIKEMDNLGLFLGANFYFDPSGRSSLFGEFGGVDVNYFKVGIKSRF